MESLKSVEACASACMIGSQVIGVVKAFSRGKATEAVEFDGHDRPALVYLFTSRLYALLNDKEFRHWAIMLTFEGDDVRTVEGLVDDETNLYAEYTKEAPASHEDGKYYFLGECVTSPKKLLELCKSNNYNKQEYLPTWQNCQSWVKELGRKLGEDIAKQLENHKTLMEARPFFAKIGRSSSAFSNFSSRPYQKMSNVSKETSGKQA